MLDKGLSLFLLKLLWPLQDVKVTLSEEIGTFENANLHLVMLEKNRVRLCVQNNHNFKTKK